MIYEKDESMVFRRIEDETILVPIRNNAGDLQNIYILNEVGARVWELLDGKREIEEISDIISSEYDIITKEVERDISEFIEDLKSIGAVKGK